MLSLLVWNTKITLCSFHCIVKIVTRNYLMFKSKLKIFGPKWSKLKLYKTDPSFKIYRKCFSAILRFVFIDPCTSRIEKYFQNFSTYTRVCTVTILTILHLEKKFVTNATKTLQWKARMAFVEPCFCCANHSFIAKRKNIFAKFYAKFNELTEMGTQKKQCFVTEIPIKETKYHKCSKFHRSKFYLNLCTEKKAKSMQIFIWKIWSFMNKLETFYRLKKSLKL